MSNPVAGADYGRSKSMDKRLEAQGKPRVAESAETRDRHALVEDLNDIRAIAVRIQPSYIRECSDLYEICRRLGERVERIRQQAYEQAIEAAIKSANSWASDVFHYEQCSLEECERCDRYLLSPLETIEEKIRFVIPAIPQREHTVRKLAEWLHWKLSAAQNLPYEDGDTCPDCVSAIENELLPILYFPKAAPSVQRGPLRQSDSAASELTGEKLREIAWEHKFYGSVIEPGQEYDWDAIARELEGETRR